jgi:hypothetical protein
MTTRAFVGKASTVTFLTLIVLTVLILTLT